MTDNILLQCKRLYINAFKDDEEFTDYLFDLCFKNCCRYLLEDDIVVSMLFAMDINMGALKGKYIYAVATNENYRGKGYMRKLFDTVSKEFYKDYDFLCLKPMDTGLFDFYERLGFLKLMKKSVIYKTAENCGCTLLNLTDTNLITKLRKRLLPENSIEYSQVMLNLVLAYCDFCVDNTDIPKLFIIKEKLSGKVKEFLGDKELLPLEYLNVPLLTSGNEFDFAMVKFLKEKNFNNAYLGLALD